MPLRGGVEALHRLLRNDRPGTEGGIEADDLNLVDSPGSLKDRPPVDIRPHLVRAQALHDGAFQAGGLKRINKHRGTGPAQRAVGSFRVEGLARLGSHQLPKGFAPQKSADHEGSDQGGHNDEQQHRSQRNPNCSAVHDKLERKLA